MSGEAGHWHGLRFRRTHANRTCLSSRSQAVGWSRWAGGGLGIAIVAAIAGIFVAPFHAGSDASIGWGESNSFPVPPPEGGPLWEPELGQWFEPLAMNLPGTTVRSGTGTEFRASAAPDSGECASGAAVPRASTCSTGKGRKGWATIPRERDISPARFAELAARGQPFIVTDAGRGLPLLGVECRHFAQAWPNASMRAEYFDREATGAAWEIFRDEAEGEDKISLAHPLWWNRRRPAAPKRGIECHMAADEAEYAAASAQAGAPAASPAGTRRGAAEHVLTMPTAELAAPYIWHVKDQEPIPTKRSVQAVWDVPYFARSSSLNAWEASESFEFWFSLPGGGTMAHGDAYCELTISLQLRGRKRWRLMMMPVGEDEGTLLDTRDGQLYEGATCRERRGRDSLPGAQ